MENQKQVSVSSSSKNKKTYTQNAQKKKEYIENSSSSKDKLGTKANRENKLTLEEIKKKQEKTKLNINAIDKEIKEMIVAEKKKDKSPNKSQATNQQRPDNSSEIDHKPKYNCKKSKKLLSNHKKTISENVQKEQELDTAESQQKSLQSTSSSHKNIPTNPIALKNRAEEDSQKENLNLSSSGKQVVTPSHASSKSKSLYTVQNIDNIQQIKPNLKSKEEFLSEKRDEYIMEQINDLQKIENQLVEIQQKKEQIMNKLIGKQYPNSLNTVGNNDVQEEQPVSQNQSLNQCQESQQDSEQLFEQLLQQNQVQEQQDKASQDLQIPYIEVGKIGSKSANVREMDDNQFLYSIISQLQNSNGTKDKQIEVLKEKLQQIKCQQVQKKVECNVQEFNADSSNEKLQLLQLHKNRSKSCITQQILQKLIEYNLKDGNQNITNLDNTESNLVKSFSQNCPEPINFDKSQIEFDHNQANKQEVLQLSFTETEKFIQQEKMLQDYCDSDNNNKPQNQQENAFQQECNEQQLITSLDAGFSQPMSHES